MTNMTIEIGINAKSSYVGTITDKNYDEAEEIGRKILLNRNF